MSDQVIEPTIGRIVHYHPSPVVDEPPMAAVICGVHDKRRVNLRVFDRFGDAEARRNVLLVQPADDQPDTGPYCCWMPYQVKKGHGSESGESSAGTQKV